MHGYVGANLMPVPTPLICLYSLLLKVKKLSLMHNSKGVRIEILETGSPSSRRNFSPSSPYMH